MGQILQLVEHVDADTLILPRHLENPHIMAGEVAGRDSQLRCLLDQAAPIIKHSILVWQLDLQLLIPLISRHKGHIRPTPITTHLQLILRKVVAKLINLLLKIYRIR